MAYISTLLLFHLILPAGVVSESLTSLPAINAKPIPRLLEVEAQAVAVVLSSLGNHKEEIVAEDGKLIAIATQLHNAPTTTNLLMSYKIVGSGLHCLFVEA